MSSFHKRPELLSPAGDPEALFSAVTFGADAVYLGAKSFGMRTSPANFSFEQLKQASDFCHSQGVKLYLTCNVIPRHEDVERLPDFFNCVKECNVDAVIVSDIGVLTTAKKIIPEVDIHISTQAGITNYLAANAFYDLGAKRVVLARELSLDEIKILRDKTNPNLEIEAFVHGSMCVSFSGRCLLSQYLLNRDPNRGACSQPCRWKYSLLEERRPGQYFDISEDTNGTYILNSKDLCMISHIDKLVAAGIDSLKIEGRAKSAYYSAVVTNVYRCAIDAFLRDPDNYKPEPYFLDELDKVSHRPYYPGFFFGPPDDAQEYPSAGYIRNWDIVATVNGYSDGMLSLLEKNRFSVGDEVEILAPGLPPYNLTIQRIITCDGDDITTANHPHMLVKIPSPRSFPVGSVVRVQN